MMKTAILLIVALISSPVFGGWAVVPSKSTADSLVWVDAQDNRKGRYESVLGTSLNYRVGGPDGSAFAPIDMTPIRDTSGGNDGWRVTQNGWHFFLGQPAGKATDGWVGFGGRQGERWIYQRLVRAGYMEYTGRTWDDISGAPNYARANLTSTPRSLTLGPPGAEQTITAAADVTWRNVWTTPAGGELYLTWRAEGRSLKEEVVLNAAARTWIAANRPPATAPATTYFGFVFHLDVSDVPRVVKNGALQDLGGDFDDDNGSSRIGLKTAGDAWLGFMPVSVAFSQDRRQSIRLRKRIWKDGDGNVYLLVGAKVADLNSLSAGDVIFDPTISSQPDASAGDDTHVRSDFPTTNLGTSSSMEMATTLRKGLIRFNLSAVPSVATCDSAILTIYSNGGTLSTHTLYSVSAANSGWTEAGATYNTRDGTNAWAGTAGLNTSGTDYEASAIASGTYNFNPTGTATSFSLSTTRVKGWFGGSNTNYGILYTSNGGVDFVYASDYTNPSLRPKFVVGYTDPNALKGGVSYPISEVRFGVDY